MRGIHLRTGIPLSTLYNVLRGVRRPSWKRAELLAEATNRGPEFFMALADLTEEQRERALAGIELTPWEMGEPPEVWVRPTPPATAVGASWPSPPTAHKDDGVGRTTTTLPLRPRPQYRCRSPRRRPCPWLSCPWHLWRDITYIRKFVNSCNNPDVVASVVTGMRHTCMWDLCSRPHTARELGRLLGVSHQAISQAENRALDKIRNSRRIQYLERWERWKGDDLAVMPKEVGG